MAATRPYFLVFKGQQHIIDAPTAAHAVQHVVGADVAELRPARAAEVSAWVRDGKTIPVAAEKRVAAAAIETTAGVAAQPGASDLVPSSKPEGFDAHDAGMWMLSDVGFTDSKPACAAWDRMVAAKRMTLEDFDIIRTASPSFADAVLQYGASQPAADVEQVRASLEENPMALNDLFDAIGNAMSASSFQASEAE